MSNVDALLNRTKDMQGDKKRTTIFIFTEVYAAFTRACRANRTPISGVLEALMMDFIQRQAFRPAELRFIQFSKPEGTRDPERRLSAQRGSWSHEKGPGVAAAEAAAINEGATARRLES